jgi:hypothetical protein
VISGLIIDFDAVGNLLFHSNGKGFSILYITDGPNDRFICVHLSSHSVTQSLQEGNRTPREDQFLSEVPIKERPSE